MMTKTNQAGEGVRLRHACVKTLPLPNKIGPLQAVGTHTAQSRFMYLVVTLKITGSLYLLARNLY